MDDETAVIDTPEAEPAEEVAQDAPEGDEEGAELSIEQQAETMGWRPLDQFSGDKSYFVEAEEFVRNADEKMPVMRSNLRKMQREIVDMKANMDLQADMAKAGMEAQRTRLEAEYDTKLRETVQNGDTEEYDRVTTEKTREMKAFEVETPAQPAADAGFVEAFEDFQGRNTWYDNNRAATDFANAEGQRVRDANPGITPQDELKKVENAVKGEFPTLFGNPARKRASAVGNGRRPAGNKTTKTYAAMPEDFRAACDDMERDGVSRADFVKNYYAMQE